MSLFQKIVQNRAETPASHIEDLEPGAACLRKVKDKMCLFAEWIGRAFENEGPGRRPIRNHGRRA
jgi:hypothetical protein